MNKKKSIKTEITIVIIITTLLIIYYLFYFFALAYLLEGSILRIIMCIFPFIFGAIMIKVCIERIKEIKGGEADDFSKY